MNDVRTSYTYNYRHLPIKISEAYQNHEQEMKYDYYDRLIEQKEMIHGRYFVRRTEYDGLGRVKKEFYPSGYAMTNLYDANGYLTERIDGQGRSIWKIGSMNAHGQLTSCFKGGKQTTYSYDAMNRLEGINSSGITAQQYAYDAKGNLLLRSEDVMGQYEEFTYDRLNRLLTWRQNGVGDAFFMNYDDGSGVITRKSDLGYYTDFKYHSNKPHAVASLENLHDATPSFPTRQLAATYTDFKKLKTLSEGNRGYAITYGVDEQRKRTVYSENGGYKQVRYYMGDYEVESNNVRERKIHYLSGGDGLAAIYVQWDDGRDSLLYAYTDNLGSVIALTDAHHNVLERYAYNPWGERKNPSNWKQNDSRTSWITNRGYTGHEHLDQFGVINMNGRVYDPLTAMFLSPDPFVQAPNNWLNYNRYGYCYNNPFKYTDPSGEIAYLLASTIAGGIMNWAANGGEFTWKGLGHFAVGAAIGVGSAALGDWIVGATQTAGIVSGGFVGAGTSAVAGSASNVLLNGANNLLNGQNFWNDWGNSALSGALSGAISGAISGGMRGYELSNESGLNYWWGNKVMHGRTQWSFFTSEKPYMTIEWDINKVGSLSLNDCVPTSFAEASDYLGGSATYEDYKRTTNYQDGIGVPSSISGYDKKISDHFSLSEIPRKDLNDPVKVLDFKESGGLIHSNMPYGNGVRHSDNLRSIRYYHSGKTILDFRVQSFRWSSVNSLWRFYLLKGVK